MMIIIILLTIGGVVITGGFIYLLAQPRYFNAQVSRTMNVPARKIYAQVAAIRSWHQWNPWMMHEPEAEMKHSGRVGEVGSSMSWDGKYIGAGTLTLTALDKHRSVEFRIDFIRPFRVTNKVTWQFVARGAKTEASWSMIGEMPFFFRFMTKAMEPICRSDFRMGLLMLNRLLDKKSELFKLDFIGPRQRPGCTGIYDTYQGSLKDLPQAMQKGFMKLFDYVKTNNVKMSGVGFSAYWKVDMKKNTTICDSVLPVQQVSGDTREYPGGKHMLVRYYGDYKNLELAWYAVMSHTRMKKMKVDKKKPSLEVYEKNPMDTKNPDEYVTDLYVPLA